MADGSGVRLVRQQAAFRSSRVPATLPRVFPDDVRCIRAGSLLSATLPETQVALLLAAGFLLWLFWRLVSKRHQNEALLHAQIRERESRLLLLLYKTGCLYLQKK